MRTINLKEHIEIIKNKLQQLQIVNKTPYLQRCLSENDIAKFEKKYDIQLPEEYRLFLLEIGDGNNEIGPGYGLYSLNKASKYSEWHDFKSHITTPFFFEKDWLCDKQYAKELTREYLQDTYGKEYKKLIYDIPPKVGDSDGSMILCHYGCGDFGQLVIKGSQKGKVWNNNVSSASGMWNTNKNFLEWYEEWVNERTNHINEKLTKIDELKKELLDDPCSLKLNYRIGELYSYLHDFEKANSFFDAVIDDLDRFVVDEGHSISKVYQNLCYQKDNIKDYSKLIQVANKAINILSPDDRNLTIFYNYLGITYYKLREYNNAIKYLQIAIKKGSELAYCWLGTCYRTLGQYKTALRKIQKAPKDKYIINLLAAIYAEMGEWSLSLSNSKKAIKLDPEWIVPKDNRGYHYSLMGKYDKAIKIHKEVIKKDPNYEWAYYHIAVAYALQKKIKEALPYFIKAVELGYDKEEIKIDKYIKNLKKTKIYKQLIY